MSSPVTAQLILIKGEPENFQQVIDLHSVNRSIGRAASCDIMWGSLQISRKHATLEYMLPKWYIRDSSTNGLHVNGAKVGKGELFPLNDADIIGFIPTGSVQYRFRYVQNTPPRNSSTGFRATTNYLGISRSPPLASTSRGAIGSSSLISPARPRQIEARGRPSVEVIASDNDNDNHNHSDSEDSNHSESLLSLDPPDADFLSFSGDDQADAEAPSPSLPSIPSPADSDESSGPFASKRKHGESDSDSNSMDRRKKRLLFSDSSAEDEESCESSTHKKSDDPIPSTSSCSRFKNLRVPNITGFLTDDQISDCSDLDTLKKQFRQCLTKLASTEVKLKTVQCERVMEKEEYYKKETDVESLTAAMKEENFKKIMELLESELSCAVCNEIFIQATVVDCGHTFCSFCITEWSKKKPECPICRKAFRNRSRHIELENFVSKMFESFNEEISTRRKASIKEREEQVKKAAEVRLLPDPARPGAPGVNNANFHTFMQRTAETYVDFLAELHQFNELLGPRTLGRGNSTNAAERRRSARIQDRVIEAVATGAAGPASRPTQSARRGRTAGARGRAAPAHVPVIPIDVPDVATARLPAEQAPRQNATSGNPIPVVNLDDSSNGGNGNPAQPLRFPNQLLNYIPRLGARLPR